ncbi:amine oxidase [Hymenobacter sp. GOD-10R]|uniref:amine oxidase n=1 Tax=Hymenobacter sp. GOD-10R TaxID=3093922 RepID=UPI002D776F37|nr:amine oxidase [Hymenobacter sp. GOD-10R]WRQ28886.1 amine oxidase [Hymenobacter sp. GOD-10R]
MPAKHTEDPDFGPNPFQSFWMGGYECTDQLNAFGNRVDFLNVTNHLELLNEDYQDLKPFGIGTVREGIRWSFVEKIPYQYDWSTVQVLLDAGKRHGIQQVWDLCHFGYPDDLTPLHPMFARRFAALCRAFVEFYRSQRPDDTLIITPINEVSFMSWLGGDARGTSPYCVGQGWEVKYRLMKGYVEGVAALREADPSVRILTTEPLINIVPPPWADADHRRRIAEWHDHQFQSVDMLSGRICPELGGRPEFIDILGFNFYYDNQWQLDPYERIPWAEEPADARWRPLNELLMAAHKRYNCPVVLTETSHPGVDRPKWTRMIAEECAQAIRKGVPLWGVCLYPIIDRPDWDHLTPWHQSGLWDAELRPDGEPHHRVLYEPYATALRAAQAKVAAALPVPNPKVNPVSLSLS